MGNFKAVIFDLDGVLVDTAEFHYLSWKRLADELGIPFDRQKNERLKGVPRMQSLEIVLEDVRERPADLEALAERKNGYYVEMVMNITPADLLPGVGELLQALRERDVQIGVASSSKNARTVIRLLQIERWLGAVVDGYDYEHPKPAPDLFLRCAAELDVCPPRCVVVEDAQVGIEAARAAGMYAVGVGSPENLQGADLLISRTADLPLTLWQ
ncbi:MAG: beta-phosphoglucomutase [Armatimonadota bacterium]